MARIPSVTSRQIAVLSMLLLSPGVSRAQTAQLGGGLGLAVPGGNYGGSTLDYYAGTAYGLANGYDIFLKGRLGLVGIGFTGELNFSSFTNSGNSEPGKGSVQVQQSILSVRIGPEASFGIPGAPVTGYVGANIALNDISGRTTFQGVAKVPSGAYDVNGTVRMGIGLSAGALITLGPTVKLDVGAEYNVINLLGKTWEPIYTGGILSSDNRIDSYLALHDVADPLYKGDDTHFIAASRSIQTIELRVGVMMGM